MLVLHFQHLFQRLVCQVKISNYIVFVWVVMNLLDGSWFDAGPKWSTSFKQLPPSNQPHHLVPNLIST